MGQYVLSALRYMREKQVATVEPRAEAQAAFIADLDRRLGSTVWNTGGCASWYIDKTGRNSTLWPDATWRFRRRVAAFKPSEYLLGRPAARPAVALQTSGGAASGPASAQPRSSKGGGEARP